MLCEISKTFINWKATAKNLIYVLDGNGEGSDENEYQRAINCIRKVYIFFLFPFNFNRTNFTFYLLRNAYIFYIHSEYRKKDMSESFEGLQYSILSLGFHNFSTYSLLSYIFINFRWGQAKVVDSTFSILYWDF